MKGNNSVSVVVVCFNAEDSIEETLISILNQSYKNIELIIKDGESRDNTLRIVNSYKDIFEQKSIRLVLVSKKDKGIYDAMNQAVEYCRNDWISFMNCGDSYYDDTVIEDSFHRKIEDDIGIIYGHAKYQLNLDYDIIIESNIVKSVDIAICHQALFIRSDLLSRFKFDIGYKLVADRDLVFKILSYGYRSLKVNTIICVYRRDGVSSKDYVTLRKEIYECNEKYGLKPNKYSYVVSLIKTIVNQIFPFIADLVLCKKNMKRKK